MRPWWPHAPMLMAVWHGGTATSGTQSADEQIQPPQATPHHQATPRPWEPYRVNSTRNPASLYNQGWGVLAHCLTSCHEPLLSSVGRINRMRAACSTLRYVNSSESHFADSANITHGALRQQCYHHTVMCSATTTGVIPVPEVVALALPRRPPHPPPAPHLIPHAPCHSFQRARYSNTLHNC